MKKSLLFLTLILCVVAVMPTVALAKSSDALTVNAREAVLASENGQIVFSQNGREKRPIASMTKIMTLCCVYDAIRDGKIRLDDTVTVSQNAASMGGSQVFLDANTTHKVGDLIKSVVICSANDSCVALAEHVSGSVENFVATMNERADKMGLVATHFENCTGLPAVSQFSCAEDVAKMFADLIKNPHYFTCSTVWTEDYVHPGGRVTGMTNTNKLVRFYDGCDGGKTGFTNEAQFCLAATAKRGNTRLIAVVVGAPDSKTRFQAVSNLFNYGFANYETKTFLIKNAKMDDFVVVGGKKATLKVKAEETLSAFGKKGENYTLEVKNGVVNAPVLKGDSVGRARLFDSSGNMVGSVNVIACESVYEKGYFDIVKDLIIK